MQYPPTGLSSGNIIWTCPEFNVSHLAVPSNGSLLWQPVKALNLQEKELSCSTLQRVSPLATTGGMVSQLLPLILQYPPTGLSSGNDLRPRRLIMNLTSCRTLQRISPLATIYHIRRHRSSLKSCSTLQRVSPLATPSSAMIAELNTSCSTLQRVSPLAT